MHAYDLLVLINVLTVNRAVIKDFKVLGICILKDYPVSKANNHMVSSVFE